VSISTDLPRPACALAIGSHPDDIEFGCGGTIAKWASEGAVTHLLVLTDGSKGSWDPDADLGALIERRRHEQQRAADTLGAASVTFLDLVDGELEPAREERAAVCAVVRRVRPDIVLGHDPWKRYRLHPDHRAAGWLTLDALVAARDPHFFPEAGEPHRPGGLLLFEPDVIDHVEDITAFLDAKARALLCHESQWRSTMGIDTSGSDVEAQLAAFDARVRGDAATAGEPAGVALGEAFKRIDEL
jgi:LmbE family N-acetylglucosaminyl deacetylase